MTESADLLAESPSLPQPSTHPLECLLEACKNGPTHVKSEMLLLESLNRKTYLDAAGAVVRSGRMGSGYDYLLARLLESGAFIEILCDPDRLKNAESVEILRSAIRIDNAFDIKLTRWLLDHLDAPLTTEAGAQEEVLLELLGEVSSGNRLLPLIVQFMRAQAKKVRSKAAMLLAQRSNRVELALADEDPRVRANAIEALWGIGTVHVRRVLRVALSDPHNRVVGNALIGLYMLGDRSVIPDMEAMAKRPEPLFKATAAWVMGQTGEGRFLEALRTLESEGPEEVTKRARLSLAQLEVRASKSETQRYFPLRALRLETDSRGNRRLLLHARMPSGLTDADVSGVVHIRGGAIGGVQVRKIATGTLALGVTVPVSWPEEVHAALRRLVTAQRGAHRMAVLPYTYQSGVGVKAGGYSPIAGLTFAKLAADEEVHVAYSLNPKLPPPPGRERGARPIFRALAALMTAPASLAEVTALVIAPHAAAAEALGSLGLEEVLRHVDRNVIHIHGIAVRGLPEAAEKVLKRLCGESGGCLLHAENSAALGETADVLFQGITTGLEVTFPAPPVVPTLDVEVKVGANRGRISLSVNANDAHAGPGGQRVWFW